MACKQVKLSENVYICVFVCTNIAMYIILSPTCVGGLTLPQFVLPQFFLNGIDFATMDINLDTER